MGLTPILWVLIIRNHEGCLDTKSTASSLEEAKQKQKSSALSGLLTLSKNKTTKPFLKHPNDYTTEPFITG